MCEEELIRRAREGDGDAIEALYRRHADRVYSIARRMTGDEVQAEDVAQEAWLRALQGLRSFGGRALFSTWLHRIAVNCALQKRRRSGSTRESAYAEVFGVAAAGGEPLLRLSLERALDSLPAGMRRVLVLHDIEGYTHEEIADVLGVTAGTCKSQLFKARAKMRAMLRPTVQGEEYAAPERRDTGALGGRETVGRRGAASGDV